MYPRGGFSMRILVTGISGQLGHDLLATLADLGEVVGVDRAQLDLSNAESIRDALGRIAPQLIVNPAAYTAVDRAESEPELAMQVNGVAPGLLAREAQRLGARLLHYSTDYVFDGAKRSPYLETDSTAPLGVYGSSKLAGEQAIAATGCRHLIMRTSWVYSPRGRNFLTTMFRLAGQRDELRVVDDQIGAPTSSLAIAQASATILRRWLDAERDDPAVDGVHHLSCSGATSWCGFAKAIVDRLPAVAAMLGEAAPANRPRVTAISTRDYPTPARRPANSVLDNGRLLASFGVAMPSWQDALDALLASRPPGSAR